MIYIYIYYLMKISHQYPILILLGQWDINRIVISIIFWYILIMNILSKTHQYPMSIPFCTGKLPMWARSPSRPAKRRPQQPRGKSRSWIFVLVEAKENWGILLGHWHTVKLGYWDVNGHNWMVPMQFCWMDEMIDGLDKAMVWIWHLTNMESRG